MKSVTPAIGGASSLLLCLLCSSYYWNPASSSSSPPSPSPTPDRFMSGAVPIPEPEGHHPIMYSSVVPLLYKFLLPRWDLHSMKIQFWKKHNNCTQSDSYDSGYPCPVIYHMNSLIESFASNMTFWRNLFIQSGDHLPSSEFLQDPSILWDKDVCSNLKMEPHFLGLQASSQQLQKYSDVLTQCAERNGTYFNNRTVDMSDSLQSLELQYHDTFASFTADYWGKLTLDVQRESNSLVAWTALQASLMTHQLSETQRWTHAIASCKAQQIPWSILDAQSLKDTLLSLKSSYLVGESLDYALELEGSLEKYFKLPVADCIFGDDDTLLVRLLIPVVPEEAQKQNNFVRFHPIPFVSGREDGKLCQILGGRRSIPFNLGMNGLLPCSCNPTDKFCLGWNTKSYESCSSLHGHEGMCVQALTSDIEEDIINHCPLQCRTFDDGQRSRLELVIKSDRDSITQIIPAHVKNMTYFECPGLQGKALVFKWEPVGAYEMTIPRGCKLIEVEMGNVSIPDMDLDTLEEDNITHIHLMPYHWRNGIEKEPALEEEETVLGSVQRLEGTESKIAYLAGKLQQMSIVCQERSEGEEDDSILWVMVTLSLLGNVGLCVWLYRLNKWRGVMSRSLKADRMVYQITDEDDFPIHEGMMNPLCPPGSSSSSRNCSSPHDK